MTLSSLGWDSGYAAAFHPHAAAGLEPARVALVHKHAYLLLTQAGELTAVCTGRLLFSTPSRSELPTVGDWVAIRLRDNGQNPHSADGVSADIHAVLPRRSSLSRRAAGDREEEQILASNLDTVFLVSGLDHGHNVRRIERFLAAIRNGGAQPVVLLNKADLHPCPELVVSQVQALAGQVPVLLVSALHAVGLASLQPWLGEGKTIALLGSSGVGKSTLLNWLLGESLQKTGAVSTAVGKGRHTTTSRELFPLPSGALMIDSPGLRELQLWEPAAAALEGSFPEIARLAAACRFRDCSHVSEPGCAILAALADGSLEEGRWASFRKLGREQAYAARRVDPRLAQEERERWKRIHVGLRKRTRFEQGLD